MSTEAKEQTPPWTWADQLSSWRFWGLLIAYILIIPVSNAAMSLSFTFLMDHDGIASAKIGNMGMVRWGAAAYGFCLAWLIVRWRPAAGLAIMAFLTAIGLTLSFIPVTMALWVRYAGWVAIGISTGTFALVVPAVVAGGKGGAEAFLVSFGAISSLGVALGMATFALFGAWVNARGMQHLVYVAVIPVTIGAIILLTLKAELFSGPPPVRGYGLSPKRRDPVSVALLFLVPFYGLYWMYRAHGEVAATAPSRALLSPRAALFGILFVPFLYLVAMASLVDALNARRKEIGQPRVHSPVAIFVWALFLPLVAAAKIQSDLNTLRVAQSAGEAAPVAG